MQAENRAAARESATSRYRARVAALPGGVHEGAKCRSAIDHELLFQHFRRGDQAALTALVTQLEPVLSARARQLGARPHEVAELVQDTWIAAVAAADAFTGESPLLPWLSMLLRHRLVSARRAQRRRSRLHLCGGDQLGAAPAPEARTDVEVLVRSREAMLAVHRAVAALPALYREPLRLYLFEGRSAPEIARLLGLGRVTTRVRLHRGMRHLRRRLPDALGLLFLALLSRRVRAQQPMLATVAAGVLVVGAAAAITVAVTPRESVPIAAVAATPGAGGAVATTATPAPPRRHVLLPSAPEPGTVTVGVRDSAGRPLANVGLTATPAAGKDPLLFGLRSVTDANGESVLAGLDAGSWRVAADRGVAAIVDASSLATGARLDLTVPGGLRVLGTVVDGTGAAVAGASVWLAAPADGPLLGDDVGCTAADGSFALDGVAPGSYLAARHPRYAGVAAGRVDGPEPLRLQLVAGGAAISGIVRDTAGRPLADALVAVGAALQGVAPRLADAALAPLPPPFVLRTGDDGAFACSGIAPGLQPVAVRAAGCAPFATVVDLQADAVVRVEVPLRAGARLSGRVVDDAGAPIADAEVVVRASGVCAASDLRTGTDGAFCFDALPCGTALLAARAVGVQPVERAVELSAVDQRVELVLPRRRLRRVRLLDADARPLAGWQLWAPADGGFLPVTADANGELRLPADGLDLRRLGMRPRPPALWQPAGDLLRELADGSLEVRVPNDRVPTAAVHGVLRAPDGRPLASASVFAHDGTEVQWIGQTDRDGTFVLRDLPAAELRLSTTAPGPELPAADLPPLSLRPGQQATIEWSAPATGRVAFALHFADGSKPAAPIATITTTHPGLRRASFTAADATQALLPGRYLLHAMGEDFVWFDDHEFTVDAGRTTHVDVEVERATRVRLTFDGVPPSCRGGVLRTSIVDGAGVVRARGGVPMQIAVPQPMEVFLPPGEYELRGVAEDGHRCMARFQVSSLTPQLWGTSLRFLELR